MVGLKPSSFTLRTGYSYFRTVSEQGGWTYLHLCIIKKKSETDKFLLNPKHLKMKRLVLYPCLFLIMSFRFTGDILAQNSIYREVQATQPALAQVVYSDALFAEDKSNTRSDEVSQVVKKSTILTLNLNELKRLNDPGIEKLELKLPYDRKSLELTFIKTQLLTDDFTVISDKSNGNPVPVSRGTFYRGVLKDDPNSIATLSIFDDQLVGIVSTDSGNIVLGQLGEEYTSEYIMYNDLDLLVPFSFECETPDVAPNSDLAEEIRRLRDNNTPSERTTKCVRMYLELDYTLVNEKGGIQGAVNWMTAVYNQVQAFYSINSISTGISQIFTWTTEDPYNLGSTGEALNKFRLERPSYNGDLAHLISRGAPTGGGVAYLDVLCSNLGYAYSYVNSGYNNVPTYSWTINVIAHETGHNFGSPHTHSCSWSGGAIDGCGPAAGYSGGNCAAGPIPSNGGTIMSYCHLLPTGINFTLGFGPLPSQLVIQKINNAACLSSSCTSSQVTVPSMVSASDGLYTDKVRITWSGSSGNYFKVYRNTSNVSSSSTAITGWQTSTTYDDSNASPAVTYWYFVRAASNSSGATMSSFSTGDSGWRSASTTVTVPVSVSASDGTYSDKVRITWSGTSGNYFRVFRNTSNTTTNATVISGWQNSQMVFDDTNAAANTTYYYFVQAASSSTGANASAYSTINSGWRSASTTVTVPVSVSASDGTYSDKVRITWSGTSGNYFRVFRNTSNTTTNATVISGWQNSQMTFDDNNATANTTYYYFVQAASSSTGANASAYSSINSGWRSQSCGTPTNLAVSQITNYSATLTWSTVSGATQYSVWYNSSTGWTQIGTVTSNTANITGLSGGINYCFAVKAICGTIVGNLSASKCFTTPASSPDNTISHTGNDNNGIIMVAESAINTIMIYPNPATNNSEITVEFKSELNTTATVTLFNATGQSVINKLVPIIIGDNILQISAPDAPGVYMFKLQTGKDSYFIKKLVITAN